MTPDKVHSHRYYKLRRGNNMKDTEAEKLENGQSVMHKRYGECIVKEVTMSFGELFGVVITPTDYVGKSLLALDSGTCIIDFLEGEAKYLSDIGSSQGSSSSTGQVADTK